TNAIKKQQADISDCMLQAIPSLSNTEQLIIPDAPNLEKQVTNEGATFSGLETIDVYQSLFRQIAYVSHAPITYMDRSFALSCVSVSARVITNEIRVRVHIEKQMAPSAPVAAALSNQFFVDNDHARNHIVNVDETNERVKRNISGDYITVPIFIFMHML
ncbi:unnamed protein product, partial [Rotaria magnacalcarata]